MPLRSIVAVLLLTQVATAGPFSELFVFGDSLSDTGNTSHYTTNGPLAWLAPDTPGAVYWEGRFSNGPVFTEWLAEGLGLGPLSSDTFGGNNFAYGGAYTSGSPLGQNFFVDDLDDQLDTFRGSRTPTSTSLASLLIGANNFHLGGQTDVSIPATHVGAALADLAAAGVKNFLVLNLPWMGLTPSHSGTASETAEWNQRSIDYNLALAQTYDAFEASHPDATLFRLNLAELLNDLIATADERGFVNVTDQAAPGLEPGASGYDTNRVVDNPDEYLFWDGLHPTAAVHRLLGYAAVRTVLPAGDYDRDGAVTAADYEVWRAAYGSTTDLYADGDGSGRVDAADYTLWRDAWGVTSGAHAAPEPSAWLLAGAAGAT